MGRWMYGKQTSSTYQFLCSSMFVLCYNFFSQTFYVLFYGVVHGYIGVLGAFPQCA